MGCATLRHNVRSIAREASAAPAAKFKSPYRTLRIRQISLDVRLELIRNLGPLSGR